ncbi:MAG: HD family phosphohydrolase [Gemmatimonadota bacterium]|nr:MAG: HD family phosphohydrolase [Gemmatimonadota bacterium]
MKTSQNATPPAAPEATPAPPTGPALDAVVARIQEISSLPTVALHVMEIAADPESGAADLKAAVEADPALCVRVLRCVNSAAFGLRTQIDTLNQAVSYLGFNQIRDLAVTATVSTLFKSGQRIHTYDRPGLWKHLVAVGVCARMIAARTKVPGFENAFLSGLLHDLGLILADQHVHEPFHKIMVSLNSSKSLVEFERKVLPWTHAELGSRVALDWKLPTVVQVAMLHHHAPEEYSGPHEPVLHCVALANLICSIKDITSVGQNLVGLPRTSLATLGLNKDDIKILAEDVDAEFDANQHLFDIQKGS